MRNLLTHLTAILLLLVFSGCTNATTQNEIEPSMPIDVPSTYSTQTQSSDITNVVSQAKDETTVVDSEILSNDYQKYTVETLDNGVKIQKDASGKEVGMTFPKPETHGEPLDEDTLEMIVRSFIRTNLTPKADEYQLCFETTYAPNLDCYTFTFSRFYHGYPSEDTITVVVYSDGTIRLYTALYIDGLENVDIPEIDKSVIEKRVNSEIAKVSNVQRYEINHMALVYTLNQKLQMLVSVTIEHGEENSSSKTYFIDIK